MSYTDINEILQKFEGDKSISDVHLSAGEAISYRKVGNIEALDEE